MNISEPSHHDPVVEWSRILTNERSARAGIKGDYRDLVPWRKTALVAAVYRCWPWARFQHRRQARRLRHAAGGGQVASTERIKIALITHAPAGDTFWDTVRKGAEEAAAKDNVELLYTAIPRPAGRHS